MEKHLLGRVGILVCAATVLQTIAVERTSWSAPKDLESWTGVWGQSTRAGGSMTGGYLQLQPCESSQACKLQLKYFWSKDGQAHSCSGENLPLKLASPTTATNVRTSGSGAPCDITLRLDSSTKQIQGKMEGAGCDYFCTGTYFMETYPFSHKALNLTYDFQRCERSPAWRTWCTTKELQDLDQTWQKLHDKLDDIRGENTISQAWRQRDQMVTSCKGASDTVGCIRSGYAKLDQTINKAMAPAQKLAKARLQAAMDKSSIKRKDFSDWAGTWEFSYEATSPQNEGGGTLEVTKCTPSGCDYNVMSGTEVSMCQAEGKFHFSKSGAFDVIRDPAKDGHTSYEDACRITFKKSKNAISVDSEGNCNPLCGVSGGGPYGTFEKKRASFSCSGKLSRLEALICNTPDLGQADIRLANLFSKRKQELKKTASRSLVRSQKDWIKTRNKVCGAAKKPVVCLRRMYHDRITELKGKK